jgi:pyruvate dehydrogenase E1 component
VIAATDYVRALPELIRAYVPRRYVTLGADGFGRSDTRQSLREFFEVDRASIVLAALKSLVDEGVVERAVLAAARERYGKNHEAHGAPWTR